MLKAQCPDCGEELTLHVDLSEGPPGEVGMECDCGAIPIWKLEWCYEVWLGGYLYDERVQAERKREDYYLRCICNTSTDYARHYIPQASLSTLRRCLEEIKGRGASKTLRGMIEARIRRLERGRG